MKKTIVALTMLAALAMPQMAAAQGHHKTVAKQQPDTTAIDVFSDTTSVDSADEDTDTAMIPRQSITMNIGPNDVDDMVDGFEGMFNGLFGAMIIVFVLFVVCPVSIIGVVCYFIYRYRKQRLQLAEMAMKNGQPIPEDTKPQCVKTADDYWKNGVRNVAIGLGLAVLFFCVFGMGFMVGVGLFIAIYGAGQIVIAKTTRTTQSKEETTDSDVLTEKDF